MIGAPNVILAYNMRWCVVVVIIIIVVRSLCIMYVYFLDAIRLKRFKNHVFRHISYVLNGIHSCWCADSNQKKKFNIIFFFSNRNKKKICLFYSSPPPTFYLHIVILNGTSSVIYDYNILINAIRMDNRALHM